MVDGFLGQTSSSWLRELIPSGVARARLSDALASQPLAVRFLPLLSVAASPQFAVICRLLREMNGISSPGGRATARSGPRLEGVIGPAIEHAGGELDVGLTGLELDVVAESDGHRGVLEA